MIIKKQMIHKFTGIPDKNGDIYSKDCKVIMPKEVNLTIGFKGPSVGKAFNFRMENNILYGDLCINLEVYQNLGGIGSSIGYAVLGSSVLKPDYDPNLTENELKNLPIEELEIIEIGLTDKPASDDIEPLKQIEFEDDENKKI